ncbi:MAG: hypothetical protein A2140_06840 [Candidatus Muproteobacteria bacterium RBG_16_62_13]|uniref:Diguanylate cyclase n=1 Tax=Candidatus Muproteobacteria bacterium RBG_16_62_13 TaxID=1817756 RepID=A0A1F6T3C3_9PROT|nr:MAG: hypothetical protein A2140_06840 [Candidatus Muproteobacteria bacterium RBG_16_62_13]
MAIGAGLVIAGFVLLSLFGAYSVNQGLDSLAAVYQKRVVPNTELQTIEQNLKEVRFRLAAYLLHQAPAVGSRQHAESVRSRLRRDWDALYPVLSRNPEIKTHADQVNQSIGKTIETLDRLEDIYRREDRRQAATLLEDHWPYDVHLGVIKPIEKMLTLLSLDVKTAYHDQVQRARDLALVAGIFVLLLMAGIITYVVSLVRNITSQMGMAVREAGRIAGGDLADHALEASYGEIGEMLSAVDRMRREIRERQNLLKTREVRLSTILDNTAEGIFVFDAHGLIESFNQSAENLFGWRTEEVEGAPVTNLIYIAPENRREHYLDHFLRNEIQKLVGLEGELTGRHRDGATFPISIKISQMTLEGKPMYVALVADISERRANMEKLQYLADHDGLTGLYNRSYFTAELERVVERARRGEERHCALLYMDLDHFKYVNDTLGHAAGDRLLIEATALLKRRARKSDLVARMGGDEFTLLAYNVQPEHLLAVADDLRTRLSNFSITEAGQTVTIGCSIGVARITADMESATRALAQADLACHLAKRGGRNRVHIFRDSDIDNANNMTLDMGWSNRIRHAIENNRFALACQPIVNTRTSVVEDYEVLIRMIDDNNELIMPGGFLPAAERFGLAADIDRWVIVHAIQTLSEQRRVLPHLRYSINLSAQTLTVPDIVDLIEREIKASGLDPVALLFEVTETVAISDMTVASNVLARLKLLGCRTALDDFGSGMSSFAYLRELPVDVVKIDGRFVKNLATNPVDQAMVRAMNEIAHALGKLTVAEFVEDEASFRLLGEIGVDFSQGYYLGRPEVAQPCQAIAERAGGGIVCSTARKA